MKLSRFITIITTSLVSTLTSAVWASDIETKDNKKDIEIIVVNGKQQQKMYQYQYSKGISNADVFSNNTSIDANNLRNEAGALDIGIRGVQGEGRVQIFIDGSLQSTHTNRGYMGTSDRTYIDSDLISNLDIEKGPSSKGSVFGAGAIGGTVQIRTLSAEDILTAGQTAGMLLKLKTHNNNKMPQVSSNFWEQQYYEISNHNETLDFDGGGVTVATAIKRDKFNALLAFSNKRVGNYFAGEHGYETLIERTGSYERLPPVNPNGEVVNTSFESQSYLAKFGINFTDEHKLEITSRLHQQEAGEVLATYWYKMLPGEEKWWKEPDANGKQTWKSAKIPEGVELMPQWKPGTADVTSHNLLYHFAPKDNALVNLKFNLWQTDANLEQYNALGSNLGPNAGQYFHEYNNKRRGIGLFNTSFLHIADTIPVSLMYGLSRQDEDLTPADDWQVRFKGTPTSRNGEQIKNSLFANAQINLDSVDLSINVNHHDSISEDFQTNETLDFSPKTDITLKADYQVFSHTSVYAKYSNAYRMPSLYESTVSNEVFTYSPDYPVAEENIVLYEVGFESQFTQLLTNNDELKLAANYFNTRINDMIATGFLPSKKPDASEWEQEFTFTNYDKFVLPGVELELSYNNDLFNSHLSYTYYTDVEMCSELVATAEKVATCNKTGFSGSLTPLRIPPNNNLVVGIGKQFFDDALDLGLTYKGHSEKHHPGGFLSSTGITALKQIPSSYQLDFYVNYSLNDSYSAYATVTNITDRYIVSSGSVVAMPEPGRTITVGVEIKI